MGSFQFVPERIDNKRNRDKSDMNPSQRVLIGPGSLGGTDGPVIVAVYLQVPRDCLGGDGGSEAVEKLCKIFFLAVILESQFSDLAKELEFAHLVLL